jgi:hypothetical protein
MPDSKIFMLGQNLEMRSPLVSDWRESRLCCGHLCRAKALNRSVSARAFVWLTLVAALGSTALLTEPSATPATDQERVLLVMGIDYPGHLWKRTAPVLADALRNDGRLQVFMVEDPHFLDSAAVARYDAIVMHWQNWEQPGPGAGARENRN